MIASIKRIYANLTAGWIKLSKQHILSKGNNLCSIFVIKGQKAFYSYIFFEESDYFPWITCVSLLIFELDLIWAYINSSQVLSLIGALTTEIYCRTNTNTHTHTHTHTHTNIHSRTRAHTETKTDTLPQFF